MLCKGNQADVYIKKSLYSEHHGCLKKWSKPTIRRFVIRLLKENLLKETIRRTWINARKKTSFVLLEIGERLDLLKRGELKIEMNEHVKEDEKEKDPRDAELFEEIDEYGIANTV